MQINLDYNFQRMAGSNLEIPEIGCFALEANNDEGLYYYVVVQTILGETTIATCGPVIPDSDALLGRFEIKVDKIQYSEKSIFKAVSKYVNDFKKNITSAQLIDMKDALNQFIDVGNILMETCPQETSVKSEDFDEEAE